MPTSFMQAEATSGVVVIFTPRLSSTSAAPLREETLLLPCFATGCPSAEITKVDVVEILKLYARSPPVPTISSTSSSWGTVVILPRIPSAQPVISSMVS